MKKERASPATDNKEMNKLNNLQLGFPLQLMVGNSGALWPGYMRKHPQVLKNLIKSQKAIAMKTQQKAIYF